MLYVVLLVRGARLDFPVDVERGPFWTETQAHAARQAALRAHPNAQILGVY